MRRTQAQCAQRPRVRQGGRHVLHRSRQALCPSPRSRRSLLRLAGRIEDRVSGLSHSEPERLRPLTRRQGALRGGYRRRAALGVRCRGAGRAAQAERSRAAWRPAHRRIGRAGAFRQPGGDGQRQHRGGDAHDRHDHRNRAGRRDRARREDAGYLPDQYLLWRARHANGVHHLVGLGPLGRSCNGPNPG